MSGATAKRRGRLCAALLLAACEGRGLGCVAWDFERMVQQPRYDPYAESHFFRDGRAMRVPPEGTRALASAARERGAAIARPQPDLELLRRGRDRFEIACRPCHGSDGRAQTQVAVMMRLRPPPSLHEPRIRALGVEQIARVIQAGYGLMPAYDELLSGRDEWAVAFYVRALQLSQRVRLDSLPPELREPARRALEAQPGPPQ